MTRRTKPPFRADHVGSLLRPPALLAARAQHAGGELSADDLTAVEDASVRDVVRMQEDVGLQTATDGEFRRTSWHMDFIYQLGGVAKTDEKLMVHFKNADGELDFESAALKVHDRVTLVDTIFADAFTFLRDAASPAQTPKLTIPSPSMLHYRGGRAAIDASVYPSSTSSGSTSPMPTPRRSAASARSAAPTSSSTTRASPTSTTRRSARWSRPRAETPSTSTRPTSATSTQP